MKGHVVCSGKIGWLGLIFFSFIIGHFRFWINFFGLVYFFLYLIY